MNKGLIFDIRRFSVHDGPGIRTTVFFKGCPLTCWWCHNPEGRTSQPESSEKILTLDGKKFHTNEVTGKFMTVPEVLETVLSDRVFYEESGGGVTLSGGEPMLQPEFVAELLTSLKNAGIHTAIDTCGYVRKEELEKVSPHTDLFLFDLKLMDEQEHIEYTGVSNKLIHDNLIFLVENGKQVHIRFPVIPGITDTCQNLDGVKNFLMRLQPAVSKIHLLPYHTGAEAKYSRLQMFNRMKDIKSVQREDLAPLKRELTELGFQAFIGG